MLFVRWRALMSITYKKLWKLLIDKNMNKGDLQRVARISASSIAKLSKGENVQTYLLVKICAALKCDTSDIMEFDCSDIVSSEERR
jgi:DNA-binding Xre family transcriptional regulator